MPFFEPLPPPPDPGEQQPTGWVPPEWDRPSEATIGVPVTLTGVLAKTDRLAVVLTGIKAYTNGFTFEVVFQQNPMAPRRVDDQEMTGPRMFFGPPDRRPLGGPRLGFEFADGSRATAFEMQPLNVQDRDERGLPTGPFLRPHGGGGGSSNRWSMGLWCYPLPPVGPMHVYLELENAGIPETMTTFDASAIVEASKQVLVLWDPTD